MVANITNLLHGKDSASESRKPSSLELFAERSLSSVKITLFAQDLQMLPKDEEINEYRKLSMKDYIRSRHLKKGHKRLSPNRSRCVP